MAEGGISFGAHTVSHSLLSTLSDEQARREIRESKRKIEAETGRPVKSFCYPAGRADFFSERDKRILREEGFTCAVSMIWGSNDINSDRYALKRIAIGQEGNLSVFRAALSLSLGAALKLRKVKNKKGWPRKAQPVPAPEREQRSRPRTGRRAKQRA